METDVLELSAKTTLIRVDTDAELYPALKLFEGKPVVALDTETTGLSPLEDRLLLLQFSDGEHNVVINMTSVEDWQAIKSFLSSREHLFLAHNMKFDASWLFYKLDTWDILPRMYDTMVAEQLITAGKQVKVNLKDTAFRQLHLVLSKEERASFLDDYFKLTPRPTFTDEQLIYAAKDVEILPSLFMKQAEQLRKLGMLEIAQLEFKLIPVICRMELQGVLIDTVEWQRVVDDAKDRCSELEDEMKKITGNPVFNPKSPLQVSNAFKSLGFVLASTNKDTLSKIGHPLSIAMLEYRKAVVLRDRYGEGWLAKLGSDSRIRASFRQIGAQTGRFSSANPNLQQLPRGDLLRKAFIAGPGKKLVTADYSQIELRILAELSQDENMVSMFSSGWDIHAATAKTMFQLPELPAKDSLQRQLAKSINFGLIYGAGPDNIRAQIAEQGVQISKAEVEHLIKLYFQAFPKAQRWLDKQARRAYELIDENIDVTTRTLGGRVRIFEVKPGMPNFERGHIARQSKNTPIQGGSADITKEAMVRLDAEFTAHPEWEAHLLMTVHDELVSECREEYAPIVEETVKRCMIEGAQKWMRLTPVKVDSAISDHWEK